MRFSKLTRLFLIAAAMLLCSLAVLISISTFAAANNVELSHLGQYTAAITANALKPAACSSLNLTDLVVCSPSKKCIATGQNNLILGTAGNDVIQGKNGDDCIIAGDGDDNVQGNAGTNICIAGPGNDTYKNCTVVNP